MTNKKKNILHLTFDMRIGGTEQVIKNLIEATDLSKFNVSILCIEEPIGPFGDLLISKGFLIDSLQRRSGFDYRLIMNIRHYLKKNNIDILHCHQYTPWFYGAISSALLGVKVVFTEHGRFYPDSGSWKRKLINPLLLLLTESVTSISEATKRALIKFEYLDVNKIKVIYNGITPLEPNSELVEQYRMEYGITTNMVVFGTVARLDPIKNQPLMLRAFSKVLQDKPDCKLIIVGDGEERSSLESLASELKIKNSVVFTGYITEPINIMAVMDVFLLPSLSEGTSMTLLEAMSLGKSCVVTDSGGNPEVIMNEVNGFVTPNQELEPFFYGMLKLAENLSLRTLFGKNSLQRFNDIFTAQAMSEHYSKIYDGEAEDKINVLFDVGTFDRKLGSCRGVLDLAKYSDNLNIDFCGEISSIDKTFIKGTKITVSNFGTKQISKKGILSYGINTLYWLFYLVKNKINVVHINYISWGPSVALAAKLLNIPIVSRAGGGYSTKNYSTKWIAKYFAICEAQSVELTKKMPLDKIHYTSNFLDVDYISSVITKHSNYCKPSLNKVRIVYIGQINERKGIHVLIEALSQLSEQNKNKIEVVLIGGDWSLTGYPERIQNLIEQHQLNNIITLLNHREDATGILKNAQILVVPSISDTRPRVIMEAMMLGVFVIASDVGGIHELIQHDMTGHLIPPNYPDKLADSIEFTLKNPKDTEQIRCKGKEFASLNFDPYATANKYYLGYRSLLK